MPISNQRLISPPISPQGKISLPSTSFISCIPFDQNINQVGERFGYQNNVNLPLKSDNEEYPSPLTSNVFILKPLTKKKSLVKFLISYYVRQDQYSKSYPKKAAHKKRNPSSQTLSSSSSSTSGLSSSISSTADNLTLLKGLFGDNNSNSSRQYDTRSRKRGAHDESDEELNGTKRRYVKGTPATGNENVLDRPTFLKEGSVQYVHDSFTDDLPDFQPNFSTIKQWEIEQVLKKIGLSTSNELKEKYGLDKIDKKEVVIVSALKLTPDQYFDTKRRFFAEKARKANLKATFKKTDAQKACRIDVNKTSKLFETFQSFGLLDDKLYVEDD